MTTLSPYKEIYVGCLKLLASMLEENIFYPLFNSNKHRIVIETILPLMQITESEYRMMTEDPSNFVSLANDTCESQKSEVTKVQTAKLLEAFCDHIDGCLSFVALLCGECLKHASTGATVESMQENKILGTFYKTSHFLQHTSNERMTETCLVIISDLSYLTPRRKDVFQLFENILVHSYTFFFESSSILIKCRIALMLGYFADHIFHHSNDLFLKTIEFLLKGMNSEETEKALALQCAESLRTIIAEQELVSRLEAFINSLFPLLCTMVSHLNSDAFFEILSTIVSVYANTIDESIVKLLMSLVQRVEGEYKTLLSQGQKNNMTINLCWNVIRSIVEEASFYPEFLDKFEECLLPMFNYLVDPTAIEFDDDLLQIIPNLIKKRGSVNENMAKLFPYLPKFFEKYQCTFGSLLPALNSYIFYGKDFIIAHKECQELLLKMAISSLFTTRQVVELNNSEGAILCQLLLQTLGKGIIDPYIPGVMSELSRRLGMTINSDYLRRELFNVFLCSVCNNGPSTITSLEAHLDALMENIVTLAPTYVHQYDIKVLIIGFGNILLQYQTIPLVTRYFRQIISVIIDTLKRQTEENHKKLLKQDKRTISLEEDSDDSLSDVESDSDSDILDSEEKKESTKKQPNDNESDDEDEVSKDPEKDISITLTSLECPLKKIDEYSYIRKVINSLYAQSPIMIKEVISSLEIEKQNYLKNILQSKRVNLKQKGSRTSVPRRILKAKRAEGPVSHSTEMH
eukprot:TRINITY_DN10835_c0_g1_i7.p1 TRINITY_DN10835_c0_g1~~TRINITY_DN10835_c0_g1_i7.p1  ORF type:complete len:745 (-),score=72.50 TRINITY_DN10835_c0_g1_i7:22-2256(-)